MPDDRHERAADLLARNFTAPAPNRRWVADFTHVATNRARLGRSWWSPGPLSGRGVLCVA